MDMDGEDPIDGTAGTEAPISSLAQVQNVCCLGASLSGVVNMLVMASNHHDVEKVIRMGRGLDFTLIRISELEGSVLPTTCTTANIFSIITA
ncbi:hypothetical protein C1H46_010975 [Malus baccata]|uniref:Uncharacterized protein n=1 Tax=Malus baccata TaxID=106549 RepID=A0A540MYI6_MALBA|nr:hypothetical protein C1H46_010975 [Malus baccata]